MVRSSQQSRFESHNALAHGHASPPTGAAEWENVSPTGLAGDGNDWGGAGWESAWIDLGGEG